jgi:hypothetical protein
MEPLTAKPSIWGQLKSLVTRPSNAAFHTNRCTPPPSQANTRLRNLAIRNKELDKLRALLRSRELRHGLGKEYG